MSFAIEKAKVGRKVESVCRSATVTDGPFVPVLGDDTVDGPIVPVLGVERSPDRRVTGRSLSEFFSSFFIFIC